MAVDAFLRRGAKHPRWPSFKPCESFFESNKVRRVRSFTWCKSEFIRKGEKSSHGHWRHYWMMKEQNSAHFLRNETRMMNGIISLSSLNRLVIWKKRIIGGEHTHRALWSKFEFRKNEGPVYGYPLWSGNDRLSRKTRTGLPVILL